MKTNRPGRTEPRSRDQRAPWRPALAAALLALAGCSTPPEPTSPDTGLAKPVEPPKPPDLGQFPPRFEVYHLHVVDAVLKPCTGSYPFFDFDSSHMKPEEQPEMMRLAACMKTGALRDKRIQLVGRADPRGSEAYNEKLGLERAEKIKNFLVSQGIDPGRVLTKSLGEKDASPSPEDWPKDRHVEVMLAP